METRERKNEINRAYYARHSERLAAKEAERRRVRGPDENRRRAIQDRSTPRGFLRGLVTAARQRAAKKGIPCDITRDYLLDLHEQQEGCCALTGQPMTTIAGQGRVKTNISVDRIDSALGYIPGNVQLVCDYVNVAKGDMSLEAFLDMCRKVVR